MASTGPDKKLRGGVFGKLICLLAVVAFAVSYVYAGFEACATPDATTETLSRMFTPDVRSPFSEDELVDAAVATKDYTVGSHDRQKIYDLMVAMNTRLAKAAEAAGKTLPSNAPRLDAVANGDTAALETVLAAADDRYVLTPDALDHLDDVYNVVTAVRPFLIGTLIAAVVLAFLAGATGGRRRLGTAFVWSGTLVVAAFAAMAVWVAVDFDGFFAAFHSLFFAAGTWTFSGDSLLITMYPPEFWMGMGVVWLAVTGVLSILSIIVGAGLRHSAAISE